MRFDPVFVISAPRSGSTLLRVMLAGHPGLFCPPELNLVGFKAMQEREKALGPCPSSICSQSHSCDLRHGLQRALMALNQIDDAASRKMLDELIERDEPVALVYELLEKLAAPRRIVDKSPLYSAKLQSLENAEALFPRALYIYLYRHPYATMDSIVRNAFQSSLAKAEALWTVRNENILKFLRGVEQDRQKHVAFETLVREPERVMREICVFLEIDFDPAMLRPYEGNRMTDGIRPGTLPPGDPNFGNHREIDPRLADAWRDLEFPGPLGEDAQRVSRELGYEIPVTDPVNR